MRTDAAAVPARLATAEAGRERSIAAQELPGAGHFAKPVFHLRDDEAAKLHIGERLSAEHGDGNQMLARGRVSGSNLRDDTKNC